MKDVIEFIKAVGLIAFIFVAFKLLDLVLNWFRIRNLEQEIEIQRLENDLDDLTPDDTEPRVKYEAKKTGTDNVSYTSFQIK